jgi:hypothetical protein
MISANPTLGRQPNTRAGLCCVTGGDTDLIRPFERTVMVNVRTSIKPNLGKGRRNNSSRLWETPEAMTKSSGRTALDHRPHCLEH